ncbi:MRG/MORF4L-binding protein-like [Centruroides sculpturatus]|uniref:MRG/MORF4L-binding protein-like n=1 Tax=Centruroides sculpturatus TaxID=218467 RepID=UPI000C6D85B0|nr:MRG/MORF4L-binding protein-like [Centruroides sculpturatus]XP_023210811.1 MRG/MORF4L-binding protein-like [Centruroides sculpturatus]
MATTENENGELDWNVDMEVQFFHAMKGHKPVGVNRYFQMACIHEKFSNSINKEISSKQIWSHLDGMYDMAALHESEIIPFPNNELEFFLPDSDYGSLKSLKFADDMPAVKENEKISKSDKGTGKQKSDSKGASDTLGNKVKDVSGGKMSPGSSGSNKLLKLDNFVGSQKSGKEVNKSSEKSGKDSKANKDVSKESGISKSAKENSSKNKLETGKEVNIILKNAKDSTGKLKADSNFSASKNTKDTIGKTKSNDNSKEANVKNAKETVNKIFKSEGSKNKGDALNRGKDGIYTDDLSIISTLKPAKVQVLVKDEVIENSPKRKRSGRPLKEDSSKPSSPATPGPKRRRT